MSFSVNLGNFKLRSLDKIERLRKAVVFKLFSAVVYDTPVLTGRLRGNWQISVGEPITTTIERQDANGSAVVNEILKNSGTGPCVVNMTNNLPYAARVEFDGWSHTKAPEGMMRRNVLRINHLLQEEAKKR